MIAVQEHPDRTLNARVIEQLAQGPLDSIRLAVDILGLSSAPAAVADRLAVALLGADPRVARMADGRWALAAELTASPGLERCPFAVVDVETTGMRAGLDDRITEIAVVLVEGARREVVFESLVNPGRSIPPMIAQVTGITDQMVRSAPPFEAIADQVRAALAGRVFTAHNARFDWGFVSAELQRTRGVALDGARLCTVRLARRLLPDVGSCGLDNLTRHFGFENEARHRAAGDALVTAMLLERLLGLARGQGVRTAEDLVRFTTWTRRERRLAAEQGET
jgi:DNA polymerase-3 subunit epsilon